MPKPWFETETVKPSKKRRHEMPVCTKCGAEWTGKSICHCAACHLTFTTLRGFDAHRTGVHAKGTRRCRTEDEMRARGYQLNDHGQWRAPVSGTPHWSK